MYRRPKFLEILLETRREMAREAGFDVDVFAEIVRSGDRAATPKSRPAARMNAEPEIQEIELTKLVKIPER